MRKEGLERRGHLIVARRSRVYALDCKAIAGAVVAVLLAFVLRGYGGGRSGSEAAQGVLDTEVPRPDKS